MKPELEALYTSILEGDMAGAPQLVQAALESGTRLDIPLIDAEPYRATLHVEDRLLAIAAPWSCRP